MSEASEGRAFLSEPRFGEVYLHIVTEETGYKKFKISLDHLSTLVSDGAKMLRPYAEAKS